MTTTTKAGATVMVNGKAFRVVRVTDGTISLRGKRGGEYAMVQNVHSGAWTLCGGGSWRSPKSALVESFEVL